MNNLPERERTNLLEWRESWDGLMTKYDLTEDNYTPPIDVEEILMDDYFYQLKECNKLITKNGKLKRDFLKNLLFSQKLLFKQKVEYVERMKNMEHCMEHIKNEVLKLTGGKEAIWQMAQSAVISKMISRLAESDSSYGDYWTKEGKEEGDIIDYVLYLEKQIEEQIKINAELQ